MSNKTLVVLRNCVWPHKSLSGLHIRTHTDTYTDTHTQSPHAYKYTPIAHIYGCLSILIPVCILTLTHFNKCILTYNPYNMTAFYFLSASFEKHLIITDKQRSGIFFIDVTTNATFRANIFNLYKPSGIAWNWKDMSFFWTDVRSKILAKGCINRRDCVELVHGWEGM